MQSKQSVAVLLVALISINCAKTYNYSFSIDTSNVTRRISGSFPYYGFTIDFWDNNQSKWTPNAGILTLDLSNENLIALTKELAPAVLRVGGSPQDSVVYDINGECHEKYGFPGYDCSQTVNNGYYGCINKTRWNEINQFAIETNTTLVFGLNACYGRKSATSPMNFSNIEALINYTNAMPKENITNLHGFEFGNELQSKPHGSSNPRVDPTTYGQDFYKASQIIGGKYAILGNDGASPGYSSDFLNSLNATAKKNGQLGKDIIHRLTYHHYPQCTYPNGSHVMSVDCLHEIDRFASVFTPVTDSNGILAVMGEGADHTGGGIDGTTNTYVDNFYYIYQLCTVLKLGINSTWRSDLIGGDYELIDHKTFKTNPDYWILYIWKQFIGDSLYFSELGGNPSDNTRAYAFKSKGGNQNSVTVILVNYALHDSAQFNIKINDGKDEYNSEQYFIGPDPNQQSLQTKVMYVNSVKMEYKNGQFPKLVPVQASGNTFIVPPARIAFVVMTAA